MIAVSLCEFTRTGRFGELSLGMSRGKVRQVLGEPEHWGSEASRDDAAIWLYSEIEFYFAGHKLYMIFTDHDSLANGGETLAIDPWVIRPRLARQDLELALRNERIEFSVSRPSFDPRQCHVVTTSGVQFSFLEERDPDWEDEELGLFAWQRLIAPNPAHPPEPPV